MNLQLQITTGTREVVRPSAVRARPNFAVYKSNLRVFRQTGAHARVFARPSIKSEFQKHERKWKKDTRFISSLSDKYLHPSYARIISLGYQVVPFILRSLEAEPDDWFYALRAITGQNVVPPSAAGDMQRMTDLWLKWGAENGLISHGKTA